jgi:phosphatidylglycerophosphate synthase
VTALSLVLALAAMACFARGLFGLGLLAAWVMTFLDTVDGKLARVTVTSSRFGHLFDHIIDVVHPPLWYLAWAYGVAGDLAHLWALSPQVIAIFAGYIAGRLVESAFQFGLAGFSMFTWRPLDSYGRLITARRNPNLLLLTAAALANQPGLGLTAVACWTVASTLFLAVRLVYAAWVRVRRGPLQTWLATVADEPTPPAYARPFVSSGALPAELGS